MSVVAIMQAVDAHVKAARRGDTAAMTVLFGAAIRCLEECPCDDDITQDQREAWEALERAITVAARPSPADDGGKQRG